jgi:hypothetical protein
MKRKLPRSAVAVAMRNRRQGGGVHTNRRDKRAAQKLRRALAASEVAP